MGAISHDSGVPSWLAPPVSFTFIPDWVIQRPLVMEVFVHIGVGLWKYQDFANFEAPGWDSHYTDDDVAHTPRMCR